MSQTSACYASPKIVPELTKVCGKDVSTVKVTMRNNKDVPQSIRKVQAAHKRAAKIRLQFD
jgi:hypothetical protein